jgi:tetratricopeptide (TPR) repeat protein
VDDRRQPNLRLRDALIEAQWTGPQLAKAVNRAGAESGIALSYDRTAVAHWLAGVQPRLPVPGLLAEVFSRRLGRPVAPANLGLTPAPAGGSRVPARAAGSRRAPREGLAEDQPGPWDNDPARDLGALADPNIRAQDARQPAYSLAALAAPSWRRGGVPSLQTIRLDDRGDEKGARVTVADVTTAEQLARLLSAGDATFGGGYVRQAAAAYLAADLAPKLHAPAHPVARRRLFTAATEITYLCAFMCFDDELQGLGQRYYRAALRLATENSDQAAYAITLRAMSVQAYSLGHYHQARQLAEAAAESVRRLEPVQQAFLYGQLAVARACDGDEAGALSSMAAAERSLDHATSAAPLIGAYHVASLAHQQAAVRSFLGDRPGAIAALTVSVRHRPVNERRSRAITLAFLAELQMRAGHLDEAVQTWHRFLDDYPYVRSRRITTALAALRGSIRPYSRNAAARALLNRATALAASVQQR